MDNKSRPLRKRVSSHDVAQLAGVSQSTVSRVLSGRGAQLISPATQQRVWTTAKQLGYSPDPIAKALRDQRTNLLGIIVRDISDPFFANFISILSSQAYSMGYQIVLGNVHSDSNEALKMSSVLATGHCDGVILLGDLKDDQTVLDQLVVGNRPLIALCRGQSPTWLPTVNCDNTAGMRMIIDHLVELGHKRIAFINGGWLGDMHERENKFNNYLSELGLNQSVDYSISDISSPEGGYRAMCALLQRLPRPTAVCAADDVIAMGAMQALHDAGLRIPQDISLAGFDDMPFARFMSPRLTTVRQPVEVMGDRALRWLIELISQNEISSSGNLVQILPELIIRNSTGAAPDGVTKE
jgi:DNA-binding LacI/PurR family transcriptional regulator